MYHAIMRARVRQADASHTFYGSHALGGRRTSPHTIRAWYARLARLFPDLQFALDHVGVSGWPWDTTVTVTWSDRFAVGEVASENQGVHVLRFRWGRVVELAIHCDTQRLVEVLERKAQLGMQEALAPAIVG
jgi:ketosteroid isomerase-like protein